MSQNFQIIFMIITAIESNMVILSKIICNSVLKQYWEYRISRAAAKAITIDSISQNSLSYLSKLYVCIYRDYQYLNYWRTLFLYFIHINQENTENFILGPKPPGPNRERAETSWGRTGKGPKPLAFMKFTWKIKYPDVWGLFLDGIAVFSREAVKRSTMGYKS